MQFSVVALLALATSSVTALHNVTYTTEVVTAYTTFCPEATALTFNGQTYTASAVSPHPNRGTWTRDAM